MASVFLGDLDDFIAPSQACVNPLFTNATSKENGGASGSVGGVREGDGMAGGARMQLVLEDDGEAMDPMEVLSPTLNPIDACPSLWSAITWLLYRLVNLRRHDLKQARSSTDPNIAIS
ncbi:unnamed protein product [Discosporangium mesarthrocarpum]